MKKMMMTLAAVLCCVMTTMLTSCSESDNPSKPVELELTLAPNAETDITLKGLLLPDENTFYVPFVANAPEEITVNDFSFEVDEQPLEIGGSHALPEEDIDTKLVLDKVHYTEGTWNTVFIYSAPANTAGLEAVVKIMFRGKQVATVNVKYAKPYEVEIKTRDGYLYPGETYTASLFDYATNKPFEGLWFLSPQSFEVNGVSPVDFHFNDYTVGEEGDYNVVIPENFPFSDAEKEQGFATICLGALVEGSVSTLFRVRYQEPLKAIATSWRYSFFVEPISDYVDDVANVVDTYIISPDNHNEAVEDVVPFEFVDEETSRNQLTMFPAEGTISLKAVLKDQYPAKDSYTIGYHYKLVIESLSADDEVVDSWSKEAKTAITTNAGNLTKEYPQILDFNYYIDKSGRVSVEQRDWHHHK